MRLAARMGSWCARGWCPHQGDTGSCSVHLLEREQVLHYVWKSQIFCGTLRMHFSELPLSEPRRCKVILQAQEGSALLLLTSPWSCWLLVELLPWAFFIPEEHCLSVMSVCFLSFPAGLHRRKGFPLCCEETKALRDQVGWEFRLLGIPQLHGPPYPAHSKWEIQRCLHGKLLEGVGSWFLPWSREAAQHSMKSHSILKMLSLVLDFIQVWPGVCMP